MLMMLVTMALTVKYACLSNICFELKIISIWDCRRRPHPHHPRRCRRRWADKKTRDENNKIDVSEHDMVAW